MCQLDQNMKKLILFYSSLLNGEQTDSEMNPWLSIPLLLMQADKELFHPSLESMTRVKPRIYWRQMSFEISSSMQLEMFTGCLSSFASGQPRSGEICYMLYFKYLCLSISRDASLQTSSPFIISLSKCSTARRIKN